MTLNFRNWVRLAKSRLEGVGTFRIAGHKNNLQITCTLKTHLKV